MPIRSYLTLKFRKSAEQDFKRSQEWLINMAPSPVLKTVLNSVHSSTKFSNRKAASALFNPLVAMNELLFKQEGHDGPGSLTWVNFHTK